MSSVWHGEWTRCETDPSYARPLGWVAPQNSQPTRNLGTRSSVEAFHPHRLFSTSPWRAVSHTNLASAHVLLWHDNEQLHPRVTEWLRRTAHARPSQYPVLDIVSLRCQHACTINRCSIWRARSLQKLHCRPLVGSFRGPQSCTAHACYRLKS